MITISGYPIDLALSEGHEFASTVTKYPVEQGSDVSDNIRNENVVITLEGVVSDTPIGAIATDPTRNFALGAPLPSTDAYARLLEIRAEREPVTIETSLGKFDNMALTSLSIPRSRETGKGLIFTVTFEQIRLVTNARTTVRTSVPNASGKVKGGNRQPKTLAELSFVPTYVVSFGKNSRDSVTPSLGQPILTTTANERLTSGGRKDTFLGQVMDHYPIGKGNVADGYVQRGAYYPMAVSVDKQTNVPSSIGSSTTRQSTKIGDEEVHYDYADETWKSERDNHVVRRVPPDRRWEGVTRSRLPPE